MIDNTGLANVAQDAGLSAQAGDDHRVHIKHTWHVEHWRPNAQGVPELIWQDTFDNLVVTAGLNKYLDATLKTGLASPTWFVGLIVGPGGSNTYVAADTSASHAGWTETSATYSQGTRPAWTPGSVAAGSVDNTASKANFSITGSVTVAGCFLIDNSTKGGTTGTLLGEGNFTAGDRALINGDSLAVSITCSIS